MNFATLKGLTIPEGNVTQITDASGMVLWNAVPSGTIVLEVEKITSNTYANSETYSNEEFILLSVTPKSASSVIKVTYGGLTKTLTFTYALATSVYFGTFNGVSDEVETPTSGTLTIEGDCISVGIASYSKNKSITAYCSCITEVTAWGGVTQIPNFAFYECKGFEGKDMYIPNGVNSIGNRAFQLCDLRKVTIPASVTEIGENPWVSTTVLGVNLITVDSGNTKYKMDNLYLVEIDTNTVIANTGVMELMDYIETIGAYSFYGYNHDITIPKSVTSIGDYAFYKGTISATNTITMLSETPPALGSNVFHSSGKHNFIVPVGCGDTYKAADGWSAYADYITEASA